jgi:hypothetical protein
MTNRSSRGRNGCGWPEVNRFGPIVVEATMRVAGVGHEQYQLVVSGRRRMGDLLGRCPAGQRTGETVAPGITVLSGHTGG